MTSYSIVADEDDFLVVSKAPGVRVHGPGEGPSLIEQLRFDRQQPDLHPAHRLDLATSGLLLVAKSPQANRGLTQLFAARQVHKTYLALSDKSPGKKQGWVIGDMAKAREGSWKLLRSTQNPAKTRFASAALGNGLRLFLLLPSTGKTHQLRVALKSQGAPILGDERYGGSAADRMYLHAQALQFQWQGHTKTYLCLPNSGLHFMPPDLPAHVAALAAKFQVPAEFVLPGQ